MAKAVLDTNILVSGLLWRGTPYKCLVAAEAGLYELIFSDPVLKELEDVLIKKFGLEKSHVSAYTRLIQRIGKRVEISGKLHVVKEDPEDDKFIETAIAGEAEVIVSGDRHLLSFGKYKGMEIIKAKDFLERILKEND